MIQLIVFAVFCNSLAETCYSAELKLNGQA